jgi:hypothetical protein
MDTSVSIAIYTYETEEKRDALIYCHSIAPSSTNLCLPDNKIYLWKNTALFKMKTYVPSS